MLIRTTDNIFYFSKVSHNAFPVAFKLILDSSKVFIFENTTHDFPQRIIYDLSVESVIDAAIEGYDPEKSMSRKTAFKFKRMNQ